MDTFTFKLPDLAEGTTEAEISAWHVAVGETVKEDQPMVDMMTDKAVVEIPAPVSGVVQSIHGKVGQKMAVGSALIVLRLTGTAATPGASNAEVPARAPQPPSTPPVAELQPAPLDGGGATQVKALASPSVRRHAREAGVALEQVRGSGPHGRIRHEDIEAHRAPTAPARPSAGAIQEVPIIGMRRRIAEKMAQSKRSIPHFTYVEEVDVSEFEALRAQLNHQSQQADAPRPKLTPLPFLMRALARLLPHYPDMNAWFDEQAGVLRQHSALHMGIATQTRNGLMVPVVRNVEARDLWNCARELTRVSAAARDGKATREELSGSTLTITSLGPLGGIAATPIINAPEVAIFGPNRIVERPVVRAGQIVVRKMMNLSSSFDHRIIDGYVAAEFVQRLKGLLESPALIFIEGP